MREWWKRAACRGVDVEVFYPEHGGSARRAVAICAECPVRSHCLDDALARKEEFGIWGGLSPRERRRMKR